MLFRIRRPSANARKQCVGGTWNGPEGHRNHCDDRALKDGLLRFGNELGVQWHPEIIAECSLACLDHAASRTAKHRSGRTQDQASPSAVIPGLHWPLRPPTHCPRPQGTAVRPRCDLRAGLSRVSRRFSQLEDIAGYRTSRKKPCRARLKRGRRHGTGRDDVIHILV